MDPYIFSAVGFLVVIIFNRAAVYFVLYVIWINCSYQTRQCNELN